MEIGCSTVCALWGVGLSVCRELGCMGVCVFAVWSGCSMVLCLVLVLR